jgi:hypothetical protein
VVPRIAAISLMRHGRMVACFVLNVVEPSEEDIRK